jgi:dihydroorotase
MSHAVADCFRLRDRGYIREGYAADLVLVDLNDPWTVDKTNILAKCGWSPFEGQVFRSRVTHTFVNGQLVYENGKIVEANAARRLLFQRD